jgi:UPF0271 protein
MTEIDINCDVGEGIGNEYLLMPYISSCNIACGGHFGTEATIEDVIRIAKKNNVKIGAHPSYPDVKNFGRKVMSISNTELTQSIVSQLKLFKKVAQRNKVETHHVKPHGALYNEIAKNEEIAKLVVNAIQQVFNQVKIYVPYNSSIEKIAKEHHLEIVYEAFADRNYNEDLSLVPRSHENALITDSQMIFNHVYSVIKNKHVITLSNVKIDIKADTFCVHGDTENAETIVKEFTQLLKKEQIQVAKI